MKIHLKIGDIECSAEYDDSDYSAGRLERQLDAILKMHSQKAAYEVVFLPGKEPEQ